MGLLCSLPLSVVILACVHSRAGGLTLGCTQSPLVGSIQSPLVGSIQSPLVGSIQSPLVGSIQSSLVGSIQSSLVGSGKFHMCLSLVSYCLLLKECIMYKSVFF